MNTFQIVVICVFGIFIVFGLIAFATFKSSGGSQSLPTVVVWGTLPSDQFETAVSDTNGGLSTKLNVRYVQEDPSTFNQDLIEALADGKGPDVILLPQDLIAQYADKIYPLPYASYSLRQFEDTYIDEALLYTTPTGILALPFTVDPVVMYWNKDLLASAGYATPPAYWDQILSVSPTLTQKNTAGNITQSGVALGEYSNITDAKAILSSMFLQVGNQIVTVNPNAANGAPYQSVLANDLQSTTAGAGTNFTSGNVANSGSSADTASESVLRFYTQFSDPSKPTYSWNLSLLDSQDDFLAGNLALYFGFASELPTIRQKNPNLNFDVAMLPQLRSSKTKATFGEMDGFAVLRSSANVSAAFQTVSILTSPAFVANFTNGTGLESTLRSVVGAPPANDADTAIFDQSALVSAGWLDPNPADTDTIFATMISSIISEGARLGDALQTASDNIQSVILTSVK